MKGRSLLALSLSLLAFGCTSHASAPIAVDTPLVPFVAADIDELTGGDLDFSEEDEETEEAEAAPAPAPAAPAAPAAAPTPAPSKTPAKGK